MERSYAFPSNFLQNKFLLFYISIRVFGARKFQIYFKKYEPVSIFLIEPIAITRCVIFGAKNSPNLWQNFICSK